MSYENLYHTTFFLYIYIMKAIYKIQSKKRPDRIYIGGTTRFNVRIKEHYRCLKNGYHKNWKLLMHCKIYGIDDFEFKLVEKVQGDLLEREQYYIDTFKPKFNVHTSTIDAKGVKRPSWTRKKISEGKKGIPHNPIHKDAKSIRLKGNKNALGFKHSAESKKNISVNNAKRKPVIQLDLLGGFIKEWFSCVEASRELGKNYRSISMCACGRIKTSAGFKWVYAEKYNKTNNEY